MGGSWHSLEGKITYSSQRRLDFYLHSGIVFWIMSKTVSKLYFTNIQMRNALIQIEDQMVHQPWMPSVILGVNRGGCIPGVYLSHRLNVPHEALDVRLRDHTAKPNLTVLEKAFAFQKKILIIDDINDTGATFKYVLDNFGKPDNVKFASLINNKPSPIKMDFKGYDIDKEENPQWVVFPWEEWDK